MSAKQQKQKKKTTLFLPAHCSCENARSFASSFANERELIFFILGNGRGEKFGKREKKIWKNIR